MADVKDNEKEKFSETVKGTFSSILSKAQELASNAADSARGAAEKGKEAIEEHLREREANEIYRKLGKKVFKLVERNELELPDCCAKYIEALSELYDEDEDETPSGEQTACECSDDKECCCAGEKKDDVAETAAVEETADDNQTDDEVK